MNFEFLGFFSFRRNHTVLTFFCFPLVIGEDKKTFCPREVPELVGVVPWRSAVESLSKAKLQKPLASCWGGSRVTGERTAIEAEVRVSCPKVFSPAQGWLGFRAFQQGFPRERARIRLVRKNVNSPSLPGFLGRQNPVPLHRSGMCRCHLAALRACWAATCVA